MYSTKCEALHKQYSPAPVTSSLFGPRYSSTLFSNPPLSIMTEKCSHLHIPKTNLLLISIYMLFCLITMTHKNLNFCLNKQLDQCLKFKILNGNFSSTNTCTGINVRRVCISFLFQFSKSNSTRKNRFSYHHSNATVSHSEIIPGNFSIVEITDKHELLHGIINNLYFLLFSQTNL
jgi:hypothetical protein